MVPCLNDGKEWCGTMVALENNLFVLFFVVLALALIAALGAALWKPVLRRAWRYFVVWADRDRTAEREAKAARACREQAERELRTACGAEADALPQTAASPLPPTTRQEQTTVLKQKR